MTRTIRAAHSIYSPTAHVSTSRSSSTQALLDAVSRRVTGYEATTQSIPSGSLREGLDPDASILLLGIRGTGKTSLAILASTCIGFRLVDADQYFYQVTGLPRAAYASRHGFDGYREKELSLMQELLENNPRQCIIVCGPGSVEGTGQELVKEFKKRHPVIYIMRDPQEVHRYLRAHDPEKISKLVDLVSPSYRSLSNFEFFNFSEPPDSQDQTAASGASFQSHPSLVLKHVEDDFLRLIHSIRSQTSRPRLSHAQHSLSYLPPESKPYTYSLTIPIEQVEALALKLRSTDLVVDAIELVIDADKLASCGQSFDQSTATYITKQYYLLRRNVKLPIILHVQTRIWSRSASSTAANSTHVGSKYFQIFSHCLRLAPEYLTLDLRCQNEEAKGLIAQKVSTKVIGHLFDESNSTGGWGSPLRMNLVRQADSLGCDLLRICQVPASHEDNVSAQHFVFQAKKIGFPLIPLIAFNVGYAGRASCFANSVMTPVTHNLIQSEIHGENDWMLTVQEAQKALYASFTLDGLVFGIFGSAVNSAMSPVMHNAAFAFCGMPHNYQTFQSSSLHDLKDLVYDERFGGASISSPFKEEIMSVLDYLSPEAQAIGAVNTLVPLRSRGLESLVDRNHAGPVTALFGDNTDWIGIHTSVRRSLSPVNAVKSRTTALILGAGGMARAAVYACLRLGVQTIFIHNRTPENADKIINQFNGRSFLIHNIDLARASPAMSPRRSGTATPNHQTAGPARVHSIPSMDEPWPSGFDPPTIIVSCVSRGGEDGQPPPNITLPDAWLTSPTGGVVIEVCCRLPIFVHELPRLTIPARLQSSRNSPR